LGRAARSLRAAAGSAASFALRDGGSDSEFTAQVYPPDCVPFKKGGRPQAAAGRSGGS